jgi:hypothetical protein
LENLFLIKNNEDKSLKQLWTVTEDVTTNRLLQLAWVKLCSDSALDYSSSKIFLETFIKAVTTKIDRDSSANIRSIPQAVAGYAYDETISFMNNYRLSAAVVNEDDEDDDDEDDEEDDEFLEELHDNDTPSIKSPSSHQVSGNLPQKISFTASQAERICSVAILDDIEKEAVGGMLNLDRNSSFAVNESEFILKFKMHLQSFFSKDIKFGTGNDINHHLCFIQKFVSTSNNCSVALRIDTVQIQQIMERSAGNEVVKNMQQYFLSDPFQYAVHKTLPHESRNNTRGDGLCCYRAVVQVLIQWAMSNYDTEDDSYSEEFLNATNFDNQNRIINLINAMNFDKANVDFSSVKGIKIIDPNFVQVNLAVQELLRELARRISESADHYGKDETVVKLYSVIQELENHMHSARSKRIQAFNLRHEYWGSTELFASIKVIFPSLIPFALYSTVDYNLISPPLQKRNDNIVCGALISAENSSHHLFEIDTITSLISTSDILAEVFVFDSIHFSCCTQMSQNQRIELSGQIRDASRILFEKLIEQFFKFFRNCKNSTNNNDDGDDNNNDADDNNDNSTNNNDDSDDNNNDADDNNDNSTNNNDDGDDNNNDADDNNYNSTNNNDKGDDNNDDSDDNNDDDDDDDNDDPGSNNSVVTKPNDRAAPKRKKPRMTVNEFVGNKLANQFVETVAATFNQSIKAEINAINQMKNKLREIRNSNSDVLEYFSTINWIGFITHLGKINYCIFIFLECT